MSGRSVAIDSWQIMQVFTLGRPAIGPFSAASWQYSVHMILFATCVLCGNARGCVAAGLIFRKSFTAPPTVAWAGVNTDDGGGSSTRRQPPVAARVKSSAAAERRNLRCESVCTLMNRDRQRGAFLGPRLRM